MTSAPRLRLGLLVIQQLLSLYLKVNGIKWYILEINLWNSNRQKTSLSKTGHHNTCTSNNIKGIICKISSQKYF